MRSPLFKVETSEAARQERVDLAEQRLAESFRQLSAIFERAAAFLEAHRLKRKGYARPDGYLRRAEEPVAEPAKEG
jgi:hypothetical protein